MKTRSSIFRLAAAGAFAIGLIFAFGKNIPGWIHWQANAELRRTIQRVEALNTLNRVAYEKAEQDVRGLGTNAVPAIVRLLEARQSVGQRTRIFLAEHMPWFRFPVDLDNDLHQSALEACTVLGPKAAAALQALKPLALEQPSVQVAIALSALGDVSIPVICENLTNADVDVRYFAMLALARLAQ
jgi:hypothetical protein